MKLINAKETHTPITPTLHDAGPKLPLIPNKMIRVSIKTSRHLLAILYEPSSLTENLKLKIDLQVKFNDI